MRVGQPASLTQPDSKEQVEGKVTVVSPAADPGTTTVQVWIQIQNPGERFKPGTAMHAAIATEVYKAATVVPVAAILPGEEGGTAVLTVSPDSIVHKRAVTLGVREGNQVQILSGANPGEEVVVVGGMGLDDKTKVKVVTTAVEESDTTKTRMGPKRPLQPTTRKAPKRKNEAEAGAEMSEVSTLPGGAPEAERPHWTARHGKPIIFVILTLVAVGVYLAVSIPVAVFPSTDFPRIVVGADVGVYPIDQMLVTVTQPLEEAVNTVPGLDHVTSITSRGSAEIDLFFDWNVDMDQTLQLVNAALARVQPTLPANAKVTANRLTFAAFPMLGYSLTSDRIPQTALWELANYTMKPRLNRAAGVSSVVVQGGQVPEFRMQPDPAKLMQNRRHSPEHSRRHRPQQHDRFARPDRNQPPVGPTSDERPGAKPCATSGTSSSRPRPAGARRAYRTMLAPVHNSVMPVYTVVTANGKPAVLLNIYRQPDSNTVDVADAVHEEIASSRRTCLPAWTFARSTTSRKW